MEHNIKIFTDFATPYLQKAGENEKADMQLKFDHSLDVFENSCNICKSLSLPAELDETARIAALFHDTGRFPQYLKYKTFRDVDSCNHGTLGARTILKHKLLSHLPRKQRNTVLGAIALHNRNTLPEFISDDLRICTEIVRDSDKIDIIKVLIPHMQNVRPENKATLMGLPERTGQVTESVLQEIQQKKQVSYLNMSCLNDFRLLLLSWAYALNYKWSRREMLKRGYVEKLMAQLPHTSQIQSLHAAIMEQLNS
ncbi:HD domain-containing protein [Maridesulfovibrio sp.]|uniref:HD domain-containing protein n=1 Tax=Maridesulfovibrio sp. TaxID=2795000 RepID=UPI0029CA27C9|nr:HD domain-containing protein [Maridesulfovibrio sp.]